MAATAPVGEFTHTRLLVDDYAACFTFYRDVLGFEPVFGDVDSGYADFDTGETTLAVFERTAMVAALGEAAASPPTGDRVALVIGVESVDAAAEALTDAATFVTEPHDRPEWGVRVVHCRDPDGTLIELNEPLDG